MGRGKFTITNVTRQTYVCSDHFPENVVLDYRLVRIIYYKIQDAKISVPLLQSIWPLLQLVERLSY